MEGVTSATCRSIYVYTRGLDIKSLYALVQKNRTVRKFYAFHSVAHGLSIKSRHIHEIVKIRIVLRHHCVVGFLIPYLRVLAAADYDCVFGDARMFKKLGPDTGWDTIGNYDMISPLSRLLDSLDREDLLPKTILYSLNPNDNYTLATMMGNFQRAPFRSKVQLGSGWWFNDQRDGMEAQLRAFGNLGVLGCFIGMLTDSRSFVSYPRHEYFRRILCNLLGTWVDDGEYPLDKKALGEIVRGICYENAKRYFNF